MDNFFLKLPNKLPAPINLLASRVCQKYQRLSEMQLLGKNLSRNWLHDRRFMFAISLFCSWSTISDKIFPKCKKIKLNLTIPKHFDICFFVILPKIIFWRRDWPLVCVSTQLWDFLFLSWFPKIYLLRCSATREETRIPSLLYWISTFILLAINYPYMETQYITKRLC